MPTVSAPLDCSWLGEEHTRIAPDGCVGLVDANLRPRRHSHAAAQRQRCRDEGLRLLADEPARFAGSLNGGVLDGCDCGVELIDGGRGHAHETGGAQHPVTGSEVCFLLQHVVVLRGRAGILDLADATALVGVADEFGLLLAEVARGLIRANGQVVQRHGAEDAVGEDQG